VKIGTRLEFERLVDPKRNVRRFYKMEVGPARQLELFDFRPGLELVIVRGRVGWKRSIVRREVFGLDVAGLTARWRALEAVRLRHGYKRVPAS
jgi:predicted DNA-binding WGR domain protein